MKPNATWTLGDPTAIYTCLDTKKLAWGLTLFEMTCSPSGWSCVPDCDCESEWCRGVNLMRTEESGATRIFALFPQERALSSDYELFTGLAVFRR